MVVPVLAVPAAETIFSKYPHESDQLTCSPSSRVKPFVAPVGVLESWEAQAAIHNSAAWVVVSVVPESVVVDTPLFCAVLSFGDAVFTPLYSQISATAQFAEPDKVTVTPVVAEAETTPNQISTPKF